MIYRIKQFIWALSAHITQSDEEFLKEYLNKNEINLFNKMSIMDKKHSINTARDVKKICMNKQINSIMLIRVALLHDIGKSEYKLNVIEKSIVVILNKFSKGKIKKYSNIKCIDIYYNHASIGYEMLKQFNYSELFLFLIKNHHNSDIISNKEELQILQNCDNKN
ncbi:HD domain-containing protein [Clostridium sediminicola]|uniref:HD domain-containing protein n=1 Tax=Clostridium sediminicola TaxID=3114879 RepID=UPI0031F1D49E